MRQVRRKTNDTVGGSYLLKAKKEGVALSWGRYEEMLPQDGFGQLGLTCHDCTQGPCRLNPFQDDQQTTICGYTKTDLVTGWLRKQVSDGNSGSKLAFSLLTQVEAKGLLSADQLAEKKLQLLDLLANHKTGNEDEMKELQQTAKNQVDVKGFVDGLARELFGEVNGIKVMTGLGVLEKNAVNVAVVGANPHTVANVLEAAAELKSKAVEAGAEKGFNIVTIGDVSVYQSVSVLTNTGSAEFALLTGLLDVVITDAAYQTGNLAQLSESYPTVVADKSTLNGKEQISNLLAQGIKAYAGRDAFKIQVSEQKQECEFGVHDVKAIKDKATSGAVKGICLLAGGSNVKATQDQGLVALAEELARVGVLAVTYGKAAVTLAKYGCLNGAENGPVALGSEYQVHQAVALAGEIAKVPGAKVIGIFPELVNKEDIQAAFALTGEGVKVFTGIKLPVNGSEEISRELTQIIEYVNPKELVKKVIEQFS